MVSSTAGQALPGDVPALYDMRGSPGLADAHDAHDGRVETYRRGHPHGQHAPNRLPGRADGQSFRLRSPHPRRSSPPGDDQFERLLSSLRASSIGLGQVRKDIQDFAVAPSPEQMLALFDICFTLVGFEQAEQLWADSSCTALLRHRRPEVASRLIDAYAAAGKWEHAAKLLTTGNFGDGLSVCALGFVNRCIAPEMPVDGNFVERVEVAFSLVYRGVMREGLDSALAVVLRALARGGASVSPDMLDMLSPEWRAQHGITPERWVALKSDAGFRSVG